MRRSGSSSFQQVVHIEDGCALRSSSGARGLGSSAESSPKTGLQKKCVDEQVRSQKKEDLPQVIDLGSRIVTGHHQIPD